MRTFALKPGAQPTGRPYWPNVRGANSCLAPASASAHEREAERAADSVTDARGRTPPRRGTPAETTLASRPLSAREKAFFEPRFGHDFSRVRVHADHRSAQLAEGLGAEALTVGEHIFLGRDQSPARSRESQRLLAHELAHVKQQSRTGLALQPKLKMTGAAGDLSRALALLNGGLHGYQVSIDSSGNVTLAAKSMAGSPTAQQQSLASRLKTIINDSKDVLMTVSSGSKTLVGSYASGDVDISDVEKIGVSALIHEIEEQYQKQTKGVAYGSETSGAHGEGIKAESEVLGAKRGPQKVISMKANPDGTADLVVEIPYTFPDGKVKTMVMTVKSNNVASVTWK